MILTVEQQAQLDIAIAIETSRATQQAAAQTKLTKLEAIRLAKETLIENARSKPADLREVTAADITTFADALIASINA
jgi:DNA-binding ferritin-like protein (Dps family)